MPKKDIIAEAKKKDPFWLLLMVILTLFTILLLVDRNRFGIILAIGIALCYIIYRLSAIQPNN